MTYPTAPLGVRVRVAAGGTYDASADPSTWPWIDVTSSVANMEPITDKTGGPDDVSETTSEIDLVFKNEDARLTTGNPSSDLYPYWDIGCPIEYALDVGDGGGWRVQSVTFLDKCEVSWPSNTQYRCIATVHGGGLFSSKRIAGAIYSPLRRTTSGSTRRGFWPLETSTISAVPTSLAMDSFEGAPLMEPGQPANVFGIVGTTKASTGQALYGMLNRPTSSQVVRLSGMVFANTIPAAAVEMWNLFSLQPDGSRMRIVMEMGPSGLRLRAYDGASNEFSGGGWVGFHQHEVKPTWIDMDVSQVGSTLTVAVQETSWGIRQDTGAAFVDQVGAFTWPAFTGNIGGIYAATLAPSRTVDDVYYSMVTVTEQANLPPKGGLAAVAGWAGNKASERVQGMSNELHIASSVTSIAYGVTMGPQLVDSLLANLRDVQKADHGVLSDQLGKVSYRALSELYNLAPAITLSRSGARGQLGDISSIRDDTARVNKITVTRPNGGSGYTAQNFEDITRFGLAEGEDQSINVATDVLLVSNAGWYLARGTSARSRYGDLTLRMRVAAEYTPALATQVATLALGDRVRISSLPTQGGPDPIDLQVRGRTQTVVNRGMKQWEVSYSAVPVDAYNVFQLDIDRLDTSGTEMIQAATSTDTILMTATAGALPAVGATSVALNAAGEQITLTNVAAEVVTDTFTRTTSNSWGSIPATTHIPAQAWGVTAPTTDFATNGSAGTMSVSTTVTSRGAHLAGLTALDFDFRAFCTVAALSVTSPQYVQFWWRFLASTSNGFFGRLEITTSGAVNLLIYEPGAAIETLNISLGMTHTAGATYGIRVSSIGPRHMFKIWQGSLEPSNWMYEMYSTARVVPGYIVLGAARASGNGNSPAVFTWDNFTINNTQAFTVARSVNGVVKAQPLGNRMRLWKSRGFGV